MRHLRPSCCPPFTGIFIPSVACGAAMGRLAGRGVQAVVTACGSSLQVGHPAGRSPSCCTLGACGPEHLRGINHHLDRSPHSDALSVCSQLSLPAWAAVGAASLLAGNTRLLLTSVLIVIEAGGSTPVLVPMMIATVLAQLVADATALEVYSWQEARRHSWPGLLTTVRCCCRVLLYEPVFTHFVSFWDCRATPDMLICPTRPSWMAVSCSNACKPR